MAFSISRRGVLIGGAALLLAAVAGHFAWRGIDTVSIGGPFVLQDGSGKTVRDSDFKGKFLLVYFGYTFCPDVCPTALGRLSSVLDRMSKEQLADLAVVFISVDPQRDYGERLSGYGQAFHPLITAVTGSREEIDRVAAAYGAKYRFAGDTSKDDYAVDHTSIIYVMDREGKFLTQFTHNATPEAMYAKLQAVLQ